MKSKYIIQVLLSGMLALTLFAACDEVGDCFEGTGSIISEDRPVSPFTKLSVDDDLNLDVRQDSVVSVQLTAGENLLNEIETSVQEKTLSLANNNVCKWSKSYQYQILARVNIHSLSEINYGGSGKVESLDTLRLESLNVIINGNGNMALNINCTNLSVNGRKGAGDLILHGRADTLEVVIRHAGLFDFSDFQANVVKIHHAGTNNAYIQANQQLTATVSYVGDLFVSGNPEQVKVKETDEGKLIIVE